ncbi:hypothetical protein Taro_053546, partial [Colocasia esculenta]|nr:hypothetical protein [Colocasia esculenta]
EFNRLSACETAKEMWDKLKITYEGTNKVKQIRIDIFVQFKMLSNENITQMCNRFTNSSSSSSEDSKDKVEDSDDEAMLFRRLQRILAKKKYGSKRYFKKDQKSKEPICYKCNQPGHFKTECPKFKRKDQNDKHEKKEEKVKKYKGNKKKAMAATWDNEEVTSSCSSSSDSEEQVDLSLMVGLDQFKRCI